jgi:hypothetical protein
MTGMSNIERQVMASVGTIYTARALTSVTALKVYIFILSIWGVGKLVWVSKVFENFWAVEKNGLGAIFNYFVSAFTHAHVSVLLVLLVGAVAFTSLVTDKLATPRRLRKI